MNDAVNATQAKPGRTALWLVLLAAAGTFALWYIDIVLAVGAGLIHLPIREARPVRAAVAAA